MKAINGFLMIFCIAITPVFAQEQNANDTITKMQHDLNLSEDQVANITQIVDRYTMASNDLQKSIEDGTMNQSAIDSQKQQIKAAEDQGIAQYLRSDQLSKWKDVQAQMGQQKDADGDPGADGGADEYSNLPKNNRSP